MFIIAEVAQSHDGSLGQAHCYIDAVASTGADAIKFQTHIADKETTNQEPWRVQFSYQDDSRYDYWKRIEFTPEQWRGLKQHSEDVGLVFLSSPFSTEAAQLLYGMGIAAWKIASGEIANPFLHDYLLTTKLPVILSTGLASEHELNNAVKYYQSHNIPVAVLQCSTEYPCTSELVGLNLISEYKQKYSCPTGLSDHSANPYTGIAAATLKADILEFHVCLSHWMFGPDTIASLSIEQTKEMIGGIRHVEKLLQSPVDKEAYLEQQARNISIFTKSIVTAQTIQKGETIRKNALAARKPGTGIPVSQLDHIIGKKAARTIEADKFLEYGDME